MAERASISFLSGSILAAGASSRMGRPKQVLPLRGRPMLQRVLDEAVASRLDEIVLVLGHRADEIREALRLPEGNRVRAVVNADWARGQSTSLRLALRRANPTAAAAAILLGDQPGGDEGARALLAARADWLLEVPVEGEPPADIDTWEQYRQAGGAGPTGRG
jgi:molybdenum cofactor cytidylyltransferase